MDHLVLALPWTRCPSLEQSPVEELDSSSAARDSRRDSD